MGNINKAINKALFLFLISVLILAASCRNPAGSSAPSSKNPDKTVALGDKIHQADELLKSLEESIDGSDVNQDKYWVESTWKLECAIQTANSVYNNPKAKAEDIQAALEELTAVYDEVNTAKKPGKIGPTDYSGLSALITYAQNLLSELNGYEESVNGKEVYADTYWVTKAQKDALASAILAAQEAQTKAAANLSTQEAVDEALAALNAAYITAGNAKRQGAFFANKDALPAKIATAKEKIDGVETSADGNDIPKYETWVTPVIYNALQAAITKADTLMNNTPHARQDEIDASVQALAIAIAAFNPQPGLKPFDISQLSGLITAAQTLLAELEDLQVSVDGTEVYEDVEWISAGQKIALASAISTAQIKAADEYITPDAAEQALDALSAVYHAARSAKHFGTFTADKAWLQTEIDSAYAKMAGIVKSKDGFDVLTSDRWVTPEMMDDLDDALIAAKELDAEPYARQEAVDTEALKLAAAIAAFTPWEGLLIPGLVRITFVGPVDETITLTGDQTLSWAEHTTLTVTVAETFTSYQWYVDGAIKTGATGTSISLNARDLSVGRHTLTLKVMKGSVPYTKTLAFTVN